MYVLFEFSILLDGRFTVANYHFDFRFRAVRAHTNIVVTTTDTIHRGPEVTALVRRHADNLNFSSSLHVSSLLFPLSRLICLANTLSSIVKEKKNKRVENLKPVTRSVSLAVFVPQRYVSTIIGDTRVRQFLLFAQKLCSRRRS